MRGGGGTKKNLLSPQGGHSLGKEIPLQPVDAVKLTPRVNKNVCATSREKRGDTEQDRNGGSNKLLIHNRLGEAALGGGVG